MHLVLKSLVLLFKYCRSIHRSLRLV